ncbi:bacillithiol biosynthesis deacetylase BshB1 [Desulfotomaculum varum]
MVKVTKVDVLAVGAHPDDVEVGAGGLVTKLCQAGRRVAVVDLSAGELASNGTAAERRQEAGRAAEILGLAWRNCLEIPDRGIGTDLPYRRRLAEVIRQCQPRLILCPHWADRHPDHVNACRLVQEAWFDAGLKKMAARQPPFRPQQIWYYFIAAIAEPRFIVDISECYQTKRTAILAHQTQFGEHPGAAATFLNAGPGSLLAMVESRDRYYGSLIGSMYGEGFTTLGPLAVGNPLALLEVTR